MFFPGPPFLAGKGLLRSLMLCCCLTLLFAPPGAIAQEQEQQPPTYVATIHPLAAILERVAGDRAKVVRLLPPGSSPHTFDPKPSTAMLLHQAKALFLAGPGLDKEWTQKLGTRNRVEMLQLVPPELRLEMSDHQHGADDHGHPGTDHAPDDPHFWTDPLTVKALLPLLIEKLGELDPAGADAYQRNGAEFATDLTMLHQQVATLLQPVQNQPILLFHPSFQYLIERYDLRLTGIIESSPGREPSPRELHQLIKKVEEVDAKALFSEPQLPERSARAVAEAAGLQIHQLDPLGGIEGRRTYEEVILYNARTLKRALAGEE